MEKALTLSRMLTTLEMPYQKKLNFTINIRREKAEFFDKNYK